MSRTVRLSLVALAALGVLSPLAREPQSDTYPLSTYPMFAANRGSEHGIPTVVELLPDGSTMRLSPETIAGTDEVILTAVTVSRAVARGEADTLCEEVTVRLGSGRTARVQTERHNVVDLVSEDAPALSVEIHSECTGG